MSMNSAVLFLIMFTSPLAAGLNVVRTRCSPIVCAGAMYSVAIVEAKRRELNRCLDQAFRDVISEGVVDFDQLKRALGEWVDPGKERFGLRWPGKAESMTIIQQPSLATLKPMRQDSSNFDDTEN